MSETNPIELPETRVPIRPWVVCGHHASDDRPGRWLTASRRFVPDMIADTVVVSLISCKPDQIRQNLAGHRWAVVLWDSDADDLVATCDCVTRLTLGWPHVMQLVACPRITDIRRSMLLELGATAIVRHVEELPRLRYLVEGYFARAPQYLD